jgi:hypothetical protein
MAASGADSISPNDAGWTVPLRGGGVLKPEIIEHATGAVVDEANGAAFDRHARSSCDASRSPKIMTISMSGSIASSRCNVSSPLRASMLQSRNTASNLAALH